MSPEGIQYGSVFSKKQTQLAKQKRTDEIKRKKVVPKQTVYIKTWEKRRPGSGRGDASDQYLAKGAAPDCEGLVTVIRGYDALQLIAEQGVCT